MKVEYLKVLSADPEGDKILEDLRKELPARVLDQYCPETGFNSDYTNENGSNALPWLTLFLRTGNLQYLEKAKEILKEAKNYQDYLSRDLNTYNRDAQQKGDEPVDLTWAIGRLVDEHPQVSNRVDKVNEYAGNFRMFGQRKMGRVDVLQVGLLIGKMGGIVKGSREEIRIVNIILRAAYSRQIAA